MDMHRRRNSPGSQRSAEEAAVNGALESLEDESKLSEKGGPPASSHSVTGGSPHPGSGSKTEVETRRKSVARDLDDTLLQAAEKSQASMNPFWSPKAQAKFQLQSARPGDLDEQARRIQSMRTSTEMTNDEEQRHRREIRVDEAVTEPLYSPRSREGGLSGTAGLSPPPPQTRLEDREPVGQPPGSMASQEPICGATRVSDRPDLGNDQGEPDTAVVSHRGSRSHENQGGTGRVEEQMVQDTGVSRQVMGSLEPQSILNTEDQTLELIRMKSLVEHLTERLERVEEGRSFDSASSGRFGYVDQVALNRHFAQLEAREARAQGLGLRSNPEVRPPSSPPIRGLQHDVGPMNCSIPPTGYPTPPVHHISSRAAFDPFVEPVNVGGSMFRWKLMEGRMFLEPVAWSKEVRESSPPPPPPLSTPPPSPPPVPPPVEVEQTFGCDPGSLALVLPSGLDSTLSALGVVSRLGQEAQYPFGANRFEEVQAHNPASQDLGPRSQSQGAGGTENSTDAFARTLGVGATTIEPYSALMHQVYTIGAQGPVAASMPGHVQSTQGPVAASMPGHVQSAQVPVAASMPGHVSGAQVPVAASMPGHVSGAQVPVAASMPGYVPGAQVPVAASMPGHVPGSQVPVASSMSGHVSGAQVSVAVSPSGQMSSANVPGIVNTSGYAPTPQIPSASNAGVSPVNASSQGINVVGSGMPCPSGQSSSGPLRIDSQASRGRGEFEPGDRTFWDLPRLSNVQEPNAAVRASDWLYRSTLLLRDLSARSWQWFDRVYEVALEYYATYQRSDPLQRGQLRPDLPSDLQDPTLARLESRSVQMLLQALPDSVVSQATATRTLSSVGLLYQVLKQYQPGGLHERAELLKSLTELSSAQTPGDGVLLLQGWFRHASRAKVMNIQLPDSSLLLASLDGMAKHLLSQHAQVAFRLSLSRHSLRLDYQASVATVEEYAKVMLAEFEVLALSSEPRKPKARKIKEKEAEEPTNLKPPPRANLQKGNGKGKGGQADVAPSERPAGSSSKKCLSWMTSEGCKYGDRCRFVHDTSEEALRGRCFMCSSDSHWANMCPVKAARKAEARQEAAASKGQPGQAKAKGKGKDKDKGMVVAKSIPDDPVPPMPSISRPAPTSNAPESATTQVPQVAQVSHPDVAQSSAAQDLAREVAEVLRSLKLKALKGMSVTPMPGVESFGFDERALGNAESPYGLIDSGATAPLRHGSAKEIQESRIVTVQLAVGETELHVSPEGTLLSPTPVQPILPMACLPALGCMITWTDKGISIQHPQWGLLPVRLEGACPEIPASLAVLLIQAYEGVQRERVAMEIQKKMIWEAVQMDQEVWDPAEVMCWFSRAVAAEGCTLAVQLQFLKRMFPELPDDIAIRVACPAEYDPKRVPFNRRVRRKLFDPSVPTLLHLFAGEQNWRQEPGQIVAVDLKTGADLLSDEVFGMLLKASAAKSVSGAIAGPPCRTSSACRHAADDGPRPVRARTGLQRFGLHTNTSAEASLVQGDTVLWFRTLLLFAVLQACSPETPFLGWEHPADPATWSPIDSPLQQCPSVWAFPELKRFMQGIHAWQADFDQGAFGHERRKPTSVLTNSWYVYEHLHACRGSGQGSAAAVHSIRGDGYKSAAWATWAPGLVRILQQGWREHCRLSHAQRDLVSSAQQAQLCALSPEWQAHFASDHIPYRRDCEVCIQAASRDRSHFKQDSPPMYTLSTDIAGPFSPGVDVGSTKRYFMVFSMRLPVGSDFPWVEEKAHACRDVVSDDKPLQSGEPEPNMDQDADVVPVPKRSVSFPPPTTRKRAPLSHQRAAASADAVPPDGMPADVPSMAELFGEDEAESEGIALRTARVEAAGVDFLSQPEDLVEVVPPVCARRFVTLTWADLLPNRKEASVRFAAMRAIARLRAAGIPVLRWHADRAKEYMSSRLSTWLASQKIYETKTAPEDHAANGRAEVGVRELKRAARRCLLGSGLPSSLWPLAIRHAAEQFWRRALSQLGAPHRPMLAFGTKVQAKNREWKRRDDKAWGPRTVSGVLVGSAPQTLSAYVVRLADGTLYVSSSVYPVTPPAVAKPKYRHGAKAPLGAIRVFLTPDGGEYSPGPGQVEAMEVMDNEKIAVGFLEDETQGGIWDKGLIYAGTEGSQVAQVQGADQVTQVQGAQAQGADQVTQVQGAQVQGADQVAQVQGAQVAQVQGADQVAQVPGAQVQGADQVAQIQGAQVQGADQVTQVQGAQGAQVRGADQVAQVRGANQVAQVQGANQVAQVQGANQVAQVQGANQVAQVRGANQVAQVQGADQVAQVRGADQVAQVRGADQVAQVRGADQVAQVRGANQVAQTSVVSAVVQPSSHFQAACTDGLTGAKGLDQATVRRVTSFRIATLSWREGAEVEEEIDELEHGEQSPCRVWRNVPEWPHNVREGVEGVSAHSLRYMFMIESGRILSCLGSEGEGEDSILQSTMQLREIGKGFRWTAASAWFSYRPDRHEALANAELPEVGLPGSSSEESISQASVSTAVSSEASIRVLRVKGLVTQGRKPMTGGENDYSQASTPAMTGGENDSSQASTPAVIGGESYPSMETAQAAKGSSQSDSSHCVSKVSLTPSEEEWEVELPALETWHEVLGELRNQHHRVGILLRQLARRTSGDAEHGQIEQEDYALLQEVAFMRHDLEWHLQQADLAQAVEGQFEGPSIRSMISQEEHLHSQPILHTRLVSNQEVREHLQEWKPAMQAEYLSLMSKQAVEEVSDSQVEQWIQEGREVEILPGRGVPTEKPGEADRPPRKKYRAVICGNYQKRTPEQDAQSYYAGGADSVSLRTVLRWAGLRSFGVSTTDIRTAFLNAPVDAAEPEFLICQPPRHMILAGVVPERTKWRVRGALYGLVSSPRSWSLYRDRELRSLRWMCNGSERMLQQCI